MKNLQLQKLALALGLALTGLLQPQLRAQHGHLNAGAAGSAQGDPLIWANGADFITSSGYVKTLDFTNAGRYAGYFQQNITLTALPATPANAGPDPQAAALGAFIRARLACLEAPPGGAFAFWESGSESPTLSVTAGAAATSLIAISQGDSSAGSDPYGHIHGRRFTATKPGLYKVTFQAVDTSTNGTGGGPIHQPSAPLPVWFQAGVNLVSVEPDDEAARVRLRLAPPAGTVWQIEAASSLEPEALWDPLGSQVTGNDLLIETILDVAPGNQRFFRLRRTAP